LHNLPPFKIYVIYSIKKWVNCCHMSLPTLINLIFLIPPLDLNAGQTSFPSRFKYVPFVLPIDLG